MNRFLRIVLTLAMTSVVAGCVPGGTSALPFPAPPWNTTPPIPRPKPVPPGTTIRSPVDPKDAEFQAAYRLMRKGKMAEILRMLEEDPELITWEHQDNGGLLNAAAGYGHIQIVEYLLEHGANPNTRNQHGVTPLYNCVISQGDAGGDYVGTVDLLLAHGADIDARFYPLSILKILHGIEVTHKDTMLEYGEKLQRSKWNHSISRNAVMARLREHMELPVDAMLPLNATSLYQQLRKSS